MNFSNTIFNIKLESPINGLPLAKLMEAKVSQDGKYVMIEGDCYDISTGQLAEGILLTERTWGQFWSDVAHTTVDVASAVVDVVTVGSGGAVIDLLHGFAYLIEGYYTEDSDRQRKLYVNAFITWGMMLLPAAAQGLGMILKKFIRGVKGVKMSPQLLGFFLEIKYSIVNIANRVASYLPKLQISSLAKRVLGAEKLKIAGDVLKKALKATKETFEMLTSGSAKKAAAKNADDAAGLSTKIAKGAGSVVKGAGKIAVKGGRLAVSFLKSIFKRKLKNPLKVLRKSGFIEGRVYFYLAKNSNKYRKITIEAIDNAGNVTVKFNKAGNVEKYTPENFLYRAVGEPIFRKGRTPYAKMLLKWWSQLSFNKTEDGGLDIDIKTLEEVPPLSPIELNKAVKATNNKELAYYEGDTGVFTINKRVVFFQSALVALGYNLSKHGVDGKFGGETKRALTVFQEDEGLDNSKGKMDVSTLKMLMKRIRENGLEDEVADVLDYVKDVLSKEKNKKSKGVISKMISNIKSGLGESYGIKMNEGVLLGLKAYQKISYELDALLKKIGVKVNSVKVKNKGGEYVVLANIDYFARGRPLSGDIKLRQHGGTGVRVTILRSPEHQVSFSDSDDALHFIEGQIRFINKGDNPITFLENNKIMEINLKDLKEHLNGKKPLVVETTTAKAIKRRLNEMRGGMGLGQGFKNQDEVYEIVDIEESSYGKVDKGNKKKGKAKDSGRKISNKGSMMLGDGFKLTEETLKSLNLTKEGWVDLIESIVNEVKNTGQYGNLMFVNEIAKKYQLKNKHIQEMKRIISKDKALWEQKSQNVGKSLKKYIMECGCQHAQSKFGGYGGLNKPYQSMMPQIKKTFNTSKASMSAPKAISITSRKLALPIEMVQEMYEIQKESYKMKMEGNHMDNSAVDNKLKECYERYQSMSEGDMSGMYEEIAEMMDYPIEEDRDAYELTPRDDSEYMKFQRMGDPYDDDDFYDQEYEDEDEDGIWSDDDLEDLYGDDDVDVDGEMNEFDSIYNEMESVLNEITGEVEDNEIYADGTWYEVNQIGDNEFEVNEEGWGDGYTVTYDNGEIVGAGIEDMPAEVRQYIINKVTGYEDTDVIGNDDDFVGDYDIFGENTDPVGDDDGDVNNDGEIDKQDTYLLNRRKAIKKSKLNKKK